MHHSHHTGRAGEFLVQSVLEHQYNLVTQRVDVDGVDLWVELPSGFITVQVKAARAVDKSKRYSFAYGKSEITAVVYCYVALDVGLFLMYEPPRKGQATKKIPALKFTKENMHKTIKKALNVERL
tara:strand:+ start:1562 stop:1936 length:375 start_codon:yes stop_codon:yes gene_type:complete